MADHDDLENMDMDMDMDMDLGSANIPELLNKGTNRSMLGDETDLLDNIGGEEEATIAPNNASPVEYQGSSEDNEMPTTETDPESAHGLSWTDETKQSPERNARSEQTNEPKAKEPKKKQSKILYYVFGSIAGVIVVLGAVTVLTTSEPRQTVQAPIKPIPVFDQAPAEENAEGNADPFGVADNAPPPQVVASTPLASEIMTEALLNPLEKAVNKLSTPEKAPITTGQSAVQPAISESTISRIVQHEVAKSQQQIDIKLDQLVKQIQQTQQSKATARNDKQAQQIGQRKRLQGFNVISMSLDRKMAIVLTPTNRVITLFPGERFWSAQLNRRVTVGQIHSQSSTLLIGRNWFIDTTRIAVKKTANKTPAKKIKPKPKMKSIKAVKITPKQHVALKDWSVISFTDKGALLKTPNNEFLMINYGETIRGLGIVEPYAGDRKLYIGDYMIFLSQPHTVKQQP